MKINILRILSITICCLCSFSCSQIKCVEQEDRSLENSPINTLSTRDHVNPIIKFNFDADSMISVLGGAGFSYQAMLLGQEVGSRLGKFIALSYVKDAGSYAGAQVKSSPGGLFQRIVDGCVIDTLGDSAKKIGGEIGAVCGILGAAAALIVSPYIWKASKKTISAIGYCTRESINYAAESDYFDAYKNSISNTNESFKYYLLGNRGYSNHATRSDYFVSALTGYAAYKCLSQVPNGLSFYFGSLGRTACNEASSLDYAIAFASFAGIAAFLDSSDSKI
jgi:hypothetical protein